MGKAGASKFLVELSSYDSFQDHLEILDDRLRFIIIERLRGRTLAAIGEEIALVTGWGQSFVGSLLLAFVTTLPEITVSFAAMRIGATDLAVANMIGSNLFNLTIMPITDIIYVKGPILAGVSGSHLITAVAVVVMTSLFITGLRLKPGRFFRLSWWNCALIVLFLASAYFSFIMA